MATTALKGSPVHTVGDLPAEGSGAPGFTLVKSDLSDLAHTALAGKRILLNIFPSIDTGTCAASVRRFNQEAAALDNTVVVCVSMDLPFALQRFCGVEGIENVVCASDFRGARFGNDYGVLMQDGPLRGLLARSIVTLDENGTALHTQVAPEIVEEPDYEAALASLK